MTRPLWLAVQRDAQRIRELRSNETQGDGGELSAHQGAGSSGVGWVGLGNEPPVVCGAEHWTAKKCAAT
jgi:hypothetical protein